MEVKTEISNQIVSTLKILIGVCFAAFFEIASIISFSMLLVQCSEISVQCSVCQQFSFHHFGKTFPSIYGCRILCFSFISFFFSSAMWEFQSHCHKCHQRQLHVCNIWVFIFISFIGVHTEFKYQAHICKLFGRSFVGPTNIWNWVPKNGSFNQGSRFKMCDSMWCMINLTIFSATLHQMNFWIGFFFCLWPTENELMLNANWYDVETHILIPRKI